MFIYLVYTNKNILGDFSNLKYLFKKVALVNLK